LLINQYGKEKANAYKNQKKAQQEGFYAQSDLRNVLTVLEAYYADFQRYPSGG
jgi:hypothetical protein